MACFTVLGSIALVGVVFLSTPIVELNRGFDSDGVHYGAMAGEASFPSIVGQIAPWCYRILTPYIASLLPYQTLSNFRVLAFLSNVLSIVIFALILQVLRFPFATRLFGILLYTGSFWTLKFSFYSPAFIDYQTQLLLLLIIYFTIRRLYVPLPFLFLIAALQKESLAAYSVFSVVHLLRYDDRSRTWIRAALVLAILVVPFATLFIVRSVIDAPNPQSPRVILKHLGRALDLRFWPVLLQAAFSGLGVIPVVLLVNYQSWVRFLRRHSEWVVYALISLAFLFGGADKARLFLYVLPLAAILAVRSISTFERDASPAKLVFWAAVVLVIHWYIGGYFSAMGTFSDYLARMVPVHSAGRYLPYLMRNLCLVAALFVFTVQFIFGEWFYRPAVGFTRREIVIEGRRVGRRTLIDLFRSGWGKIRERPSARRPSSGEDE